MYFRRSPPSERQYSRSDAGTLRRQRQASDQTIITILDDPLSATHIALGRTTTRRSLAANEPWRWYQEWRLCLIRPAGRDALLPCYTAPADQNAPFGERPAILQERRLGVAPDGALHPWLWDAYHRQRTPWEAVWTGGTSVLKAKQDLQPFLAFAIERYHLYSARAAEHLADRERRLAEVARLSEQIAQIEAEMPWLRLGANAPALLDGDPALRPCDVPARCV